MYEFKVGDLVYIIDGSCLIKQIVGEIGKILEIDYYRGTCIIKINKILDKEPKPVGKWGVSLDQIIRL